MKKRRVMIDVTDPNNVFVHKGGRRKGHTYVTFNTETSAWGAIWYRWANSRVYFGERQTTAYFVP